MSGAHPPDLLPDTAAVVEGALRIAGCRLDHLAAEYGTPLYLYDEETLRRRARRVRTAFAPLGARISFAAKACSTLAILRVFHEEGLTLDAVSAGEMEAGRRAGFRPDQIHLHGNGKTRAELEQAVRLGIRAVVLDSLDECQELEDVCRVEMGQAPVMLRCALAIEAETHPALRTGGRGSKFGVERGSAEESDLLDLLAGSSRLTLVGVHAHIGSQIGDAALYRRVADELLAFAVELRTRGFPIAEVNAGGGWAVPYAAGDAELSPETVADALTAPFARHPEIRPGVEPGRLLVARGGVALYRIVSVKRMGRRRIIAVDGGLGDNPRPALYGSRYQPLPVARWDERRIASADVVGRYCESGDVIARDVALPEVRAGELLAVPVSGAYQVAMASGYNRVPPPVVILVKDGQSRLVTRRAAAEELLARECGYLDKQGDAQ